MRYLITGGCGFLGSNLASEVLARNDSLILYDNLSRIGSHTNLEWLKTLGRFEFCEADIRDAERVESVIRQFCPDRIFHLAGQVAMTTSLENPLADFQINALGTLNLLEAVRKVRPEAVVIYSSTNKVYGDLEWARYEEEESRYRAVDFPDGFDEKIPLEFHSPYGCSKGAADQYMLDYHRMFGLRTVVFRHSSMYGGRQFATYDQGWVGWFCQQALEQKAGVADGPFTISGNGKQVRDLLHAEDMKRLYFTAAELGEEIAGECFNIGGGMSQSLSLLELFAELERRLKLKLDYSRLPVRESDQKVFVADIEKAGRCLNWRPQVNVEQGLDSMIEWLKKRNK